MIRNSRGPWIVAGLLLAGAVYWGVGIAVGPTSGDTELRKTFEAMKQVKTFRGVYVASASNSHWERVWEVDCNRNIVHLQSHSSQANTESPFEMKEDEYKVGEQSYIRDSNGAWENTGYADLRDSAKLYCENLAQKSNAGELLPDIGKMISHAVMYKGSKKDINGVRCREWNFEMVMALGTRKGSICIGVDDHLPYEMTLDDGHYSYSDYNQAIPLEVPQAEVQPASLPDESN